MRIQWLSFIRKVAYGHSRARFASRAVGAVATGDQQHCGRKAKLKAKLKAERILNESFLTAIAAMAAADDGLAGNYDCIFPQPN